MEALHISRGRAKKLIAAGKVSVDGRRLNPADKGLSLYGGEIVSVRMHAARTACLRLLVSMIVLIVSLVSGVSRLHVKNNLIC